MKLNYSKKRQRGQTQKLNRLINRIDEFMPFSELSQAYEHFPVPCSNTFINSPKTRGNIKTAFIRKWIQTTEKFIRMKPKQLPFCRIVALICEENLWDSQIIIFYSEKYFQDFWIRNGNEQIWELITPTISFTGMRNIKTSLTETCYKETIREDGIDNIDKLWFYKEIDA